MYLASKKGRLLQVKFSTKLCTLACAAVAFLPVTGMVSASPAFMLNQNIRMGSFQNNGSTITMTSDSANQENKAASFGLLRTKSLQPSIADLSGLDSSSQKQKYFSDVDTAFAVANGRRSPYGSVGCAETVTYAGSYYSPALKEAFDEGIASVPGLLSDLSAKGYDIEPFNGYANKGDLLVYGDDDHVVIADGHGGCFGNSSSRLQAMHYSNAAYAWGNGELPSKVVRMS